MSDAAVMLWRRLDLPGHDAARLTPCRGGWRLTGQAVFGGVEPTAVRYALDLTADWRARRAVIDGFVGTRAVRHQIAREPDGWRLDGRPAGLADLVDLDLGFSPATNLPQTRRLDLAVGDGGELTTAWFDLDGGGLRPLTQHYRRIRSDAYAYQAPSVGYEAELEMAENGFVRTYPGLWEAVAP